MNDNLQKFILDSNRTMEFSGVFESMTMVHEKDEITFGEYREVSIDDDWTNVRRVNSGRTYGKELVQVADDSVIVTIRGTKWIPDEEAKADLVALVEKWKAEGKEYLADFTDQNLADDWETEYSLLDTIGHNIETETTEQWPLSETRFFQWVAPQWNVPKIEVTFRPTEP